MAKQKKDDPLPEPERRDAATTGETDNPPLGTESGNAPDAESRQDSQSDQDQSSNPFTDDDDVSFEDARSGAAQAQNLGPDGVPEQRPQAFLRNDASGSDLTQRLREAGDPHEPTGEPMDQAAYDRASSQAQRDKAADLSRHEGIMVGNGVKATDGPHEGRVFAVTRVTGHKSAKEMLLVATGSPEQLYNQPSGLELRAVGDERDGEIVVLEGDRLEEAKLIKLPEDWRGTRAGRRH